MNRLEKKTLYTCKSCNRLLYSPIVIAFSPNEYEELHTDGDIIHETRWFNVSSPDIIEIYCNECHCLLTCGDCCHYCGNGHCSHTRSHYFQGMTHSQHKLTESRCKYFFAKRKGNKRND